MRPCPRLLFACLLSLGLGACGDDPESMSRTDAGGDAGILDGSIVGGDDGAVDGGVDSGVDAGPPLQIFTLSTQATPATCVEGGTLSLAVELRDAESNPAALPADVSLVATLPSEAGEAFRLVSSPGPEQFVAGAMGPWTFSFDCPSDLTWGGGANFDVTFALVGPSVMLANPIFTATVEDATHTAPLPSARGLAVGDEHACAIESSESLDTATMQRLICWGNNGRGQLGLPRIGGGFSWQVPTEAYFDANGASERPAERVVEVVAGRHHTCARDTDGNVHCFGENAYFQLGSATSDDAYVATGVVATELTAGAAHTCATVEFGGNTQVWCWGDNSSGQLGFGGPASPPNIVSGSNGFHGPTAGESHTCALNSAGVPYCWGANEVGQLGTGSTGEPIFAAAPITMPVGVTAFTKLAAGGRSTCGITDVGTLYCWGANGYGQLGLGSRTDRSSATQVLTQAELPLTDVRDLALGTEHACAILGDAGEVFCWGRNSELQQGLATAEIALAPWAAPAFAGMRAVAIDAGPQTTCVVDESLAVLCAGWGRGNNRGDGLDDVVPAPRSTHAPLAFTGLETIEAGYQHVCAWGTDAGLWCWGDNRYRQVSDDEVAALSYPQQLSERAPAQLTSGIAHSCARWDDGTLSCWGDPRRGRLGDGGPEGDGPVPFGAARSPTGMADVIDLDTRIADTCAVSGGQVFCWGHDDLGELGQGTDTRVATPAAIAGITSALEVAISEFHTCVRLDTGSVQCLGQDTNGELGDGEGDSSGTTPVDVSLPAPAVRIAGLTEGTCALLDNAEVWCWGANRHDEIPYGDYPSPSPVRLIDWNTETGVPASSLSAGHFHGCVQVAGESALHCFGDNSELQLGTPTGDFFPSPETRVGDVVLLSDVRAVATGADFSCAVRADGGVSCWGSNRLGQLGTELSRFRLRPVVAAP